MRLHIHKWKYLNKEAAEIETSKYYFGMSVIGSSSETTKEKVTYIRSVCLKCGDIKSQTVKGTVTLGEIVDAGFMGKE